MNDVAAPACDYELGMRAVRTPPPCVRRSAAWWLGFFEATTELCAAEIGGAKCASVLRLASVDEAFDAEFDHPTGAQE